MAFSLSLDEQRASVKCLLLLIIIFRMTHAQKPSAAGDMEITIVLNASDVRGDLAHFWRSTGFCPPQPHQGAATFDLSPDMVQNLAYIGAVPHRGIQQVRVHWLLDLIKVHSVESQGPVYNLFRLDSLVKLMHQNDLALGFELMGNPSNLFSDFENRTQVYWFRDLVTLIAIRYTKMYGLNYVKEWNFETWNEPDCHDFDKMKFTVQGFLNYYDACSEGLKAVHPSLVLGGPGDACWSDVAYPASSRASKRRVLFDALLNHTVRGKNYFTGETGVRLDFISLHEKGDGEGLKILEREINASKYLNSLFPELVDKPFYNDEADLLVGWSRPREWRANADYAALITKVIAQHQNILGGTDSTGNSRTFLRNYALLSNDNAFLSYYPHQFTQRTLLARFQINSTSSTVTKGSTESSSTKSDSHTDLSETSGAMDSGASKRAGYVTFIRKPSYIIMGMLSLLGEKQVYLNISRDVNHTLSNTSTFGALGTVHMPTDTAHTSDSWQVVLLAYGASDADKPKHKAIVDLKWYLNPPKEVKSLKLGMYQIWSEWGNPYLMWKTVFNSTKYPTLEQFAQLRQLENPQTLVIDVPVKQGFAPIAPLFELLDPHIVLMHVCAKPTVAPEKVADVHLINVTAGQVMVVWSDRNIRTKCILTYVVERFPSSSDGPYTRVNKYHVVVNLYVHETDSEAKVRGYYRVRAVDYWGQEGILSDIVAY